MRLDLPNGFHLSPVRDGDQAAFIEHFRDKDITDCLLVVPYPYTEKDAEHWVRFRLDAALNQTHEAHFALRREDGFLVGGAGLMLNKGVSAHRAELGYWIAKDYRNQGVMTSAVRALVQYGFEVLGLRRIEALPFSQNIASQRILEKAGFTREGLLAGYHLKHGNQIDAYMFAIVKP